MDGFKYYKNLVLQIPVLSENEEYEIAVKAAEGDEDARKKLIESHLRLVIQRVHFKYSFYLSGNIALDDLIQEGNVGVLHAYENFDVTKGFRFSTYCILYIDKYIKHYLNESVHRVRIPEYTYLRLERIRKLIREIENIGGEVSVVILADKMNTSTEEMETYLKYIQLQKEEYCDTPVSDEKDSPAFVDFYKSSWGLPELEAMRTQMRDDINDILKVFLTEDERKIVDFRFTKQFTVKEISENMGCSESNISNKLTRIKKKLMPVLERDLEDYLYAA